jgi:hypothetical protein
LHSKGGAHQRAIVYPSCINIFVAPSGVKAEGTSSKKRAYANVVTAISNKMNKATLVMEKICEND